jgi:RpiB/LacA/LacB family sugar-phosphate isomerase
MRIAIGGDHAGYEFSAPLRAFLGGLGHQVEDLGAASTEPSDYPDFAAAVARAVSSGRADRGVLVCGSGIGMAVAANKVPGVRAAVVHDKVSAEMSRRHNDVNVACFGARTQSLEDVKALLKMWLEIPFDAGRHVPRIDKVRAIERSS